MELIYARILTKCKVLLLITFTTFIGLTNSYAQKNRPVVLDATTLLEILQKDYTGIEDQGLRLKTLQSDRANVISILKAYTRPWYKFDFNSTQSSIDFTRNTLKYIDRQISPLTVLSNDTQPALDLKLTKLQSLYKQQGDTLRKLEKKIYPLDTSYLGNLKKHYLLEKNKFIVAIIDKFLLKFDLLIRARSITFH